MSNVSKEMVNRQADDRQLVARAKKGDWAAFEELVKAYQRPLFAYLYRLCGNTAEAEEVAQQAFVKAWQALGGVQAGVQFQDLALPHRHEPLHQPAQAH